MSLYLGFDLSTQQLKIVSCHEDLSFHSKFSINFDEFNEKYDINKGVKSNNKTGEVITPVLLFIDAIQILFDRMKDENFPFDRVKSISGSCQQHGTVYYTSKAEELFSNIDSNSNQWSDSLKNAFSFNYASNWQDRSTIEEAKDFENSVGGAKQLAFITGSKAHYRFSGLQFRKRAKENSSNWNNTKYLGLISSLLDTFLTGKLRGIEIGEACGTNLFDIKKNDWNDELLSLLVMKNSKIDGVTKEEELKGAKMARDMLCGSVVRPDEKANIASYLVNRYKFNKNCIIWPITGDNLATIMSLPLQRDDLLISMGTSTTVLLLTEKYLPSVNYHLFKHPVCTKLFMGMLCYCNGALAREKIRNEVNEKYNCDDIKSWDKFNSILDSNNVGNNKIGIYFPLGEIIPNVKPCTRNFELIDNKVIELQRKDISIEDDVSMIIESQALSCRLRVCPMLSNDFNIKNNTKNTKLQDVVGDLINVDCVPYKIEEFNKRPNNVYYVGGSSKNETIVKKFNDILGCEGEGYRVEIGDACALGGCFRAIWGNTCEGIMFEEWIQSKFDFKKNVEKIIRKEEEVFDKWNQYNVKLGLLSLCEEKLVRE